MSNTPQIDLIKALYLAELGRKADQVGLTNWSARLEAGMTVYELHRALRTSAEARNRRESLARQQCVLGNLQKFLIERDLAQIHVVDVGAQNLAKEAHVYEVLREYGLLNSVTGFEPLQDKASVRNESESGVHIHPIALGDGLDATLHINNIDATSSVYPINTDVMGAYEGLNHLETLGTSKIATSRLDDIDLPQRVSLLKLDVQGYELRVLENATNVLKRTTVIYTEVEFQEIYKGQPLFADVDRFLRSQGFGLLDVLNQKRLRPAFPRPVDTGLAPSKLFWGDAVYLKDVNDCDVVGILEQIIILSFLFHAMDHVGYLITILRARGEQEIADDLKSILSSN